MDDEVRVRVRDRGHHVEKQLDAGVQIEAVVVAVLIDVHALHVLEDQIRLTAGRHAGVDQTRDRRMREPRDDRAFTPEALFALASEQPRVQELHRRVPSKRPSLRFASHTLPMPPWPIGETIV